MNKLTRGKTDMWTSKDATILDKINGTSGAPLPPPPISMIPKWRVFVPSRLRHYFGGKGGDCSILFCPRLHLDHPSPPPPPFQ